MKRIMNQNIKQTSMNKKIQERAIGFRNIDQVFLKEKPANLFKADPEDLQLHEGDISDLEDLER